MSDWELVNSHGSALRSGALPQQEEDADRIESWRCAGCHHQPLDTYRQQFNETCLRCFESRVSAYGKELHLTWSMHEHRQGVVLAVLSLLCWLGAATDACW